MNKQHNKLLVVGNLRQLYIIVLIGIAAGAIVPGSFYHFTKIDGFIGRIATDRQVEAGENSRNGNVAEAEKLTLLLVKEGKEYKREKSSEKLAKLQKITRERKDYMLDIARKDPGAFLRLSIPADRLSEIPDELKNDIESETTLEGTLEITHEDYFEQGNSEFFFHLQTKDDLLDLHSSLPFPQTHSGRKVSVSGIKLGNEFVLSSVEEPGFEFLDLKSKNSEPFNFLEIPTAYAAPTNTIGDQKTIVLLVNFTDNTSEPMTKEQVAIVVFDQVNNYFKDNSYNQMSVSGDVLGWYTLPIQSTCSFSTIVEEAVKAADPDVYFPNYTRLILSYPASGCGYAGIAGTVGGYLFMTTQDGSFMHTRSAVLPQYFDMTHVAHEYAHNLGLYHANARDCGASTTGTDAQCTNIAYGDPFDVLGLKGGVPPKNHLNAIHKEKLGWFNVSEVIQISADGSYTLSPLETIGGGVKAFYTKKEPYPPVYYEFRQPIGFDDDITQNVSNGLLVHLEKYGNSGDTQILDNTPETVSWLDPALSVGSTFTDLLSGVKAKVLNKDPNSLTFDLKFSPTTCIQENPSVSISPISQWSNPGESLAYTVSLINNDNSICSSSTFNLSAAISAGWTSSFLSTTLDVAPGQTGTTTVTVTSPQTNPDGFYNFSVTATNNTSSLYEDSSTATYVVDDSIAPLVSIASPVNGTTVSRKSTVVINVSASDNVSVTKVEFYVDNKLICTDSAYTYSCNWKVPPSSNRTYNLQAKAFDVAGNISTSSTVLVKSK